MPNEAKYSLTRVCLRSGQMTLPRAMIGLFPDSGVVEALDYTSGKSYTLYVQGPRLITGLDEFFADQLLEVNDSIVVRKQDETSYFLIAQKAQVAADINLETRESQQRLVDRILALAQPLSEAEIRAYFEPISPSVDLQTVLKSDPRLEFYAGRWQAKGYRPNYFQRSEHAPTFDEQEAVKQPVAHGLVDSRSAHTLPASSPSDAEFWQETPSEGLPNQRYAKNSFKNAVDDYFVLPKQPSSIIKENKSSLEPLPRTDLYAKLKAHPVEEESIPNLEPHHGSPEIVAVEPLETGRVRVTSTETPMTPSQRARAALEGLGFDINPLNQEQLVLTAHLGRHKYEVLVHALGEGQKLNWADLLEQRRLKGVDYLAVFGHDADITTLLAPAEMARASLWSWSGLATLASAKSYLAFSAVDLETFFEREGLFEEGLERFERLVDKELNERSLFSQVILSLGKLSAPSVFVIDDIVVDTELAREQVLACLERLCHAPHHILLKTDHAEYCLRKSIATALEQQRSFIDSLATQLAQT